MARTRFSIASFNLYNLNEPGLPMYTNTKGWRKEEYDAKIEWTARVLKTLEADVWGFQELWHRDPLEAAFKKARLYSRYRLLVPKGHSGQRIVCAAAVKKSILEGKPTWIDKFPDKFILASEGDDPQTPDIGVNLNAFSRPVLSFQIRPRSNGSPISVYVAHFKSKGPTKIYRDDWFNADRGYYRHHRESVGGALSTIRRTAEATALRMLMTDRYKDNTDPFIVLGDLNDSADSNTLAIVTGQPRYLTSPLRLGGSDTDLYSVGRLEALRNFRDVAYTHVYQDTRDTLDHILVSQELYDQSRERQWAFRSAEILNDHLNREDHKATGTTDHGVLFAEFEYWPRKKET